jgi:hypothetical protein
MMTVRTTLTASELPDTLKGIRTSIERARILERQVICVKG